MLSDLRLSKPDMQIEHLYMAPEIQQFIEEQKFYPNKLTEEQIGKTDVWVLGLIMVMMATNYSKFDAQSIDVQCLFTDMDLMVQLGELHEEFYKLCSDMMNLDPKRRLSLKETETRLRLAEKKILEGQESSDEEQKVEHDHFYYERKRLYKKIRQIEKQSLLNLNKIRHGDEDALFWRNWDMVENYPFWWTE
jgi:serine/threonine protein kinase